MFFKLFEMGKLPEGTSDVFLTLMTKLEANGFQNQSSSLAKLAKHQISLTRICENDG